MKQKRFNEQRIFRFKRFTRKAYSAFNSMHKVVNIGVVVGCALAFLPSSPIVAQDTNEQADEKVLEHELDEVMVTASRIELPINQVAKLVTVITKEQIAQAPVLSIQDLLVYAANIDVIQRGGHGVQADISIRGGSGDQTAVLLNGVNLSNAQTGHYSFDIPINLSDIERIEIIHGPSAVMYGSSAFAGGVNIITKKRADTKIYANTEAGMHKLRGMELRGTENIGITSNSLSVGYNASDGYIANSEYDIYNILWQTRFNLKSESKLDLQLGYNDKKYGANTFYSAAYPNQYEQTSTYMGSLKGEFGSKLKFIPIVYWDRHHDQFDLVKGTDFGRNYHRNDTYGTNLIFLYQSKLGATSLGGEFRREEIMSSRLGKPMVEPHRKYTKYDDRINTSLAFEHTVKLDKFVLSAGTLLNHNTLLKGKYKFFPSVSASYRPVDEINIYTSWSKSTRVPTFTDLYYTTETHNGNEGLRPETSSSFDFGLKHSSTFMSAYITGFLMWGRDVIDWVKVNPEDTKWASWNLTELNTQGVEMGVKFRLADIIPALGHQAALSLDYTRMNQTSDTHGLVSISSLNYLRDKFVAQFTHTIYKGFSAGWIFRYQKRMGGYLKYEDAKPTVQVPFSPFSLLDLRVNYKHENWAFNVNVNNIYNTRYADLGNIPQPGFWLIGGVSYTLK